jgi:hypothetical protein
MNSLRSSRAFHCNQKCKLHPVIFFLVVGVLCHGPYDRVLITGGSSVIRNEWEGNGLHNICSVGYVCARLNVAILCLCLIEMCLKFRCSKICTGYMFDVSQRCERLL